MADGINAIGNLQGKVDANNQLLVALGPGSTLPNDTDIDAGTGTADAGIGGVLTVSVTTAQTTAVTTEEDLWTYSLPANTLSTNGYTVRVTAVGTTAANATTKRIRLYFGGTLIADTSARASNNGAWKVRGEIFRISASAQGAVGENFITGGFGADVNAYAAPAADTTSAITIKVTGTNGTANAGDIVFRGAIVEFLRPGS
jgi:hypothetical protein